MKLTRTIGDGNQDKNILAAFVTEQKSLAAGRKQARTKQAGRAS
jgi:hypothetical protein